MSRASRLLVLMAILSASQFADPAIAAPTAGDFIYVKDHVTISGNGSDGLATAACPDGSRTTGVGGSISDSNGKSTFFNKIGGLDFGDGDGQLDNGARVEAWNDSRSDRKLTAFAVCSQGADVADLTYNTALTNVTSATGAISTGQPCAGGTSEEALGAGGGVDNNPYDRLTLLYPGDSNIGIGFRGTNPDDRNLQKTAICLPEDNRAITRVVKDFPVRPNEIGKGTAFCPRGTHVAGGGGVGHAQTTLVLSKPIDGSDRDHVPDDGWVVRIRNVYTEKDDFSAVAICAGPLEP
jgi:hypothetical protein